MPIATYIFVPAVVVQLFPSPLFPSSGKQLLGTKPMSNLRKHIWINPFQTKISLRLFGYALIYQISISVVMIGWHLINQMISNGGQTLQFSDLMPGLIGTLLLLPIVTYDIVKFTHRFVGPLVRFRKSIQAIAAGEEVEPIKLRKGDFLTDFQDDFNRMIATLERNGYGSNRKSMDQEVEESAKVNS